jgi:hypothetical protein
MWFCWYIYCIYYLRIFPHLYTFWSLNVCLVVNSEWFAVPNTALALCLISFFLCRCDPTRIMASSFTRFLDHTQRHTTVGRTPLDEWSARRKDLYLTIHNVHNRPTTMPPVEFEPTISAGKRPQTYVLDRAAIGTGLMSHLKENNCKFWILNLHFTRRSLHNIIAPYFMNVSVRP